MKSKKNLFLNLLIFIGSPILIAAGILTINLSQNNRITALGGLMICLGAFAVCMWLIRLLGLRAANKENARNRIEAEKKREKLFDDAFKSFESKTDYPEPNTLKIVGEGLEFFAEGRYVCEKDFKNIPGYHFAFEISSTDLKYKPVGYESSCFLEENGVLIAAGYLDGEALEKYANDNGIILQDTPENLIGQTLTLKPDKGYNFYIWTAEGDEIDFGFIKILKCENGVLTVHFYLNVQFGLSDTVEGMIELKKDTGIKASDIHSLIGRIKRKHYNVIEVKDEEIQEIRQTNPFLPESYITFLKEVGFADLDWIDVGRNTSTPTNLNDDETVFIKEIAADYEGINPDDFYFIAVDNGDSYYAFSRKPDNEKVYIFSTDASNIDSYETFEEFITEILNV